MSSTSANDGDGDSGNNGPSASTPSSGESSNSSDPSGFLLPRPCLVTVVGTARADANGRVGTPTSYDPGRGRYMVQMEDDRGAGALSLKPSNLRRATKVENLRHRADKLRARARRVLADPHLRRQVSQVYTELKRRLPPYLPPERLALAILFLLALSIRLLGFSKTLVVLTTSSLPLVVSLPDLVAGRDVKTCTQNFPRNLRNAVAESTGYQGVSERVALAGFVVLLAVAGKVLITPVGVAPPPPVAPASAAGGGVGDSAAASLDLDGIYKLGYDDGASGRDYGSSLPQASEASPILGTLDDDLSADLDWHYSPPPPPPKRGGGLFGGLFGGGGGKFGFGTVLSLVHLLRTGKELATGPDGRLDPNLLVANVQLLEPWKMGLLGLSLYKVLSAFL